MAGEIKHVDQITIPDDPTDLANGLMVPSKLNKALRLSGGTDKQLVERSTAADGTTGMNLTSTPTASYLIFPLNTDPATLPIGGMTMVEESGVIVWYAKKSTGSLVSIVIG